MNQTNMSHPMLSICIPTCNRPKEFERMLRGLVPQLTEEVEIVVRDDSLGPDTAEMFGRVSAERKFRYQYFRGEKIGLDAANLFLLEKASGEFIWWFGDDDELLPGGIAEVLELIRSNPRLDLIWANYDFEKPGNIAIDRLSGYFRDGSEALETLGTNIGFLSTYIIRRQKGLQGIDIARRHVIGFSFASTSVVLYVLSEPGMHYFMRGPYVLCHPTTPTEIIQITTKGGEIKNEGFNVYGVEFHNVIMEFKEKFTRHSVRKILSVNFGSLWRGMLVGWVGGWDTPRGKLWRMFKLYWSFPEFWIALPAFLMPRSLNRLLYRIYKIFFRHRKFIFGRSASNV